MQTKGIHPSDEELLLFSDRELPAQRAVETREHLCQCQACRDRLQGIESTLTDVLDLREQVARSQQFRTSALRPLLKLRLSQIAASQNKPKQSEFAALVSDRLVAICCLTLLVAACDWQLHHRTIQRTSLYAVKSVELLPRKNLTPGTVQSIGAEELCAKPELENDPQVNASIKEAVFKRYGLPDASTGSYELDYLIAPALGGTSDMENLWPQRATSTSWNAHAKDQLEDLLRALVCQHKISLANAQKEISEDWIASYKARFKTETPRPVQETRTSLSTPNQALID
jgi:hypothetical protein